MEERIARLAQAERQMRGAVCGGQPGSSRSTQPKEVAHGNGIPARVNKGIVSAPMSLGCVQFGCLIAVSLSI